MAWTRVICHFGINGRAICGADGLALPADVWARLDPANRCPECVAKLVMIEGARVV